MAETDKTAGAAEVDDKNTHLQRVGGVDLVQEIYQGLPTPRPSIYAERRQAKGEEVETLYGIPVDLFMNGMLRLR